MYYTDRGFRYKVIGTSTDTKPALTAVDAGAIFFEVDTGKEYILTDANTWEVKSPNIVSSQTILTSTGLTAGGTSSYSSVLDYHASCPSGLKFTIAGTYAASAATTGLRLQVFTSSDGTNYDTDAYATIEPSFTASSTSPQTKQKGRPVAPVGGYMKCNVVNLDGTNVATGVSVTVDEVV